MDGGVEAQLLSELDRGADVADLAGRHPGSRQTPHPTGCSVACESGFKFGNQLSPVRYPGGVARKPRIGRQLRSADLRRQPPCRSTRTGGGWPKCHPDGCLIRPTRPAPRQ